MADHVVKGMLVDSDMPENWTGRVPESLKRPQLSDWLRRGRSNVTQSVPVEQGGGFTTNLPQSKMDREQQKTRESLQVRFDRESINESVVVKKFVEKGEYNFHFVPKDSDMISLIEYDEKRMLLRTTFSNNGSVVVHRFVPMGVYEQLMIVNKNGGSVGGTFWDLLRIYERRNLPVGGPYNQGLSNFRRRGGKYGFTYVSGGTSADRPDGYGNRGPYNKNKSEDDVRS